MTTIKQKNLLVTGAAGFIGSNYADMAIAENYNVVVLDALTYAGHVANIEHHDDSEQFNFVKGNITDKELAAKLLCEHKIDALINFAAESHVDRSIDGPDEFIQTNVIGTAKLLTAALEYWNELDGERKENFRYLQVSTDEVYGSLGATGKFSEETNIQPNSPYSASKAGADHLVRAWHHTFGLPTITTHCSNNYGPRQYPEKLIPHMLICALTGKNLPVYGDGKNIRDWIHVEDHCRGIMLALQKGKLGQSYCLGGNAETENIKLVHELCSTLDALKPRADGKSYKEQIAYVEDRLGHDRRYAIDDSLAQRELGFSRKHNFESGLKETIEWYLNHTEWCNIVMGKELL